MNSVNRVMLMGRLTRDPVLRQIPGGIEVAEFGLAMSEWTGRDAERKERVCFVDVVVWDRQATACGEHLRKGMPAFIEGRLQMDEWTDKASGDRRSKLRVRAERVHFLGTPRSAAPAAGGGPADDPPPEVAPRAVERAVPSRGRPAPRPVAA